jgi:hypothetical protein
MGAATGAGEREESPDGDGTLGAGAALARGGLG